MEIEFHVLVSESFKLEEEDKVCIRFENPRLGGWFEDRVVMKIEEFFFFFLFSFSFGVSEVSLCFSSSHSDDPILHVRGTLLVPESMVVDTYLIYKYRVKRSVEFPEDEPGSYEALEFPEQNRALRLPRGTHQRYSQPNANGRKRLIHFDDMIYPQQSNSFFSRLRSGVAQAFGSSSTTVIGGTYLWNLLPALRFTPISVVTWKIISLIGSFGTGVGSPLEVKP